MAAIQMTIQQPKTARDFYRENPDGTIIIKELWPPREYTAETWATWFRTCLHAKINRQTPATGRKHSLEYWWAMRRAQGMLNQPRMIIDTLPPELEKRFPHRLRKNMDLF